MQIGNGFSAYTFTPQTVRFKGEGAKTQSGQGSNGSSGDNKVVDPRYPHHRTIIRRPKS
ncbi:MAG: hypothetical protein VKJ04_11475 [Vampirovibrionales bacterium]|nr:hypothetical protein [Vampirovibrionales bacterium]